MNRDTDTRKDRQTETQKEGEKDRHTGTQKQRESMQPQRSIIEILIPVFFANRLSVVENRFQAGFRFY